MIPTNKNSIYLVRHCENPANLTNEFSYKYVDYSLTPKGRLQAQQTASYFAGKHIHEIYASPLKRTRETAEAIAHPLGLSVIVLEDFRELNVGSLEGQPPSQEVWAIHDRIVQDWFEGRHTSRFPDGEDYRTLLQRISNGLHEITRNKTARNIIVVGHGGVFVRTLKDICPELDIHQIATAPNHNASITEIELTTINEQLSGTLKTWASIDHLYGEAAQVITSPGTVLCKGNVTN